MKIYAHNHNHNETVNCSFLNYSMFYQSSFLAATVIINVCLVLSHFVNYKVPKFLQLIVPEIKLTGFDCPEGGS